MNKIRYSLLMATLILSSNIQYSFAADTGEAKIDSEKKVNLEKDKKNQGDTTGVPRSSEATDADKKDNGEADSKRKTDTASTGKQTQAESSITSKLKNLWAKGLGGKIVAGTIIGIPLVGIPALMYEIPSFVRELNNSGYKLKHVSAAVCGGVALSNIIYQIKYRIYDLGAKKDLIEKIKKALKDKNKFCNWRNGNALRGWNGRYGEEVLNAAQNYKLKNEGVLLKALKQDILQEDKQTSIGAGSRLFLCTAVEAQWKKETLAAILKDLRDEKANLFKLKNDLLNHYKNLEPILLEVAEKYRTFYMAAYFKDEAEYRVDRLGSDKTNFTKMNLEALDIFGDKHVNGKIDGLLTFRSLRKDYNNEATKDESVKIDGIVDHFLYALSKFKSFAVCVATAYNFGTLLDLQDDYKEVYNEAVGSYFDLAFAYARLNAIEKIIKDELTPLEIRDAASGRKKDAEQIESIMVKEFDAIILKTDIMIKWVNDTLSLPNRNDAFELSELVELFVRLYKNGYVGWNTTQSKALDAINSIAADIHSVVTGRNDDSVGHMMGGMGSSGKRIMEKLIILRDEANLLKKALLKKIK